MPKERILDGIEFSYEGLMEMEKVYREMYRFWKDKGFDILETKHEEKVKDDGSKDVHLEWSCEREVTDYAKYSYSISVDATNLKKVIIKSENFQREMEVGKIRFKLNADLELDYGKLFKSPTQWLIRALLEKFVFKSEVGVHRDKVKQIGYDFLKNMQSFLNAFRTPI